MAKKNGQPTRKQIQKLIDGFESQEVEAMAELEAADAALGAAKLADIERQKAEATSGGKAGTLPRAQIFVLEDFPERDHLEYERKRAVGKLGDIQRRIKLLKKAFHLTPE